LLWIECREEEPLSVPSPVFFRRAAAARQSEVPLEKEYVKRIRQQVFSESPDLG